MRKFLLFSLLFLTSAYLFGAYGFYSVNRVEEGEESNIPGRNPEEIWRFILLYDKTEKPILKIYSRVDLSGDRVKICRYIKNITPATIRFTMVLELRYILHKAYKTVISKNGVIRPVCEEIIIGGIYNRLDWGIAVYKEWFSNNEKTGKGIIEHW